MINLQGKTSLVADLAVLQQKGLKLRMQKATQQLANTSDLRKNRKAIAKIKTLLSVKGS